MNCLKTTITLFGVCKAFLNHEHEILLENLRYTELKKQILTGSEAIQQAGYIIFNSTMLVGNSCTENSTWNTPEFNSQNNIFFDIHKGSSVLFSSIMIISDEKSLLLLYHLYNHSYIDYANLV